MKKLLVIKAHPFTGEQSTSMKVLEKFMDVYQAENANTATVQLLDLYTEDIPEIDHTLLSAMTALKTGSDFSELTAEQQAKMNRFNELTDQFLDADQIVIANALWNLNIPTRLKAWVDTINVANKTFKYTATGPAPLTEGKKVLHIQSNGGMYDGKDFASMYLKGIMNFVGVTDYHQLFIEAIDHHPEQRDEILGKALDSATAIAKEF
ncbi:FMN-dependent NADH-azoreductase [Vagococcus sp. PNs007]|uniref:FMN dependent NADH:quinone oxidoreductase n=1 Tax=Vagococcus proximus TaxID=2991417 RepID=A0ABT5WYD2_9ENTE|nr:FMN-dependent NADH-azoreductase [Vagococcus proximus]MDF0478686.1 FMN-dependent NADH-azoreductase [Vagococcus proximus]